MRSASVAHDQIESVCIILMCHPAQVSFLALGFCSWSSTFHLVHYLSQSLLSSLSLTFTLMTHNFSSLSIHLFSTPIIFSMLFNRYLPEWLLNFSKTEFLQIGLPQQPAHSARKLDFIFDERVPYFLRSALSKSCYYHIGELRCSNQENSWIITKQTYQWWKILFKN